MGSVTVLMSTYNGERFLCEQIDSILNQKDVEVNLLVRDDGSTDNTKAILQKYADQGKLQWYSGKNLGPGYSFLDLVHNAPEGNYYAFSDQDDVWNVEKLNTAVKMLDEYSKDKPVLYYCTAQPVSVDLVPIAETTIRKPITTFSECLVHNNIPGCTMVFSKAMFILLNEYIGDNLVMHDDLLLKVCLAVGGTVIKGESKHVLYRQHGNNVVGSKEKFGHAIKRRMKALFQQSCERSCQLKDIYNIYKERIPEKNREMLAKVAFYKERPGGKFSVVFDKRIKASNPKTTRHFRVGILLGFF